MLGLVGGTRGGGACMCVGAGVYEQARGALGQICTQVHLSGLSVGLPSVPSPL